jgi:hypothetical protein
MVGQKSGFLLLNDLSAAALSLVEAQLHLHPELEAHLSPSQCLSWDPVSWGHVPSYRSRRHCYIDCMGTLHRSECLFSTIVVSGQCSVSLCSVLYAADMCQTTIARHKPAKGEEWRLTPSSTMITHGATTSSGLDWFWRHPISQIRVLPE